MLQIDIDVEDGFGNSTHRQNPIVIKSDYHSANYTRKNLDIWMYTNSTEVILNYNYDRFGQQKFSDNAFYRKWFEIKPKI